MIEVLKQALKAFEVATTPLAEDRQEILKAITSLRQAIKALESQEPVGALTLGGIIDTSDGPEYEDWDVEWNTKLIEALQEKFVTSNSVELMLYTHPPQRKPPTT